MELEKRLEISKAIADEPTTTYVEKTILSNQIAIMEALIGIQSNLYDMSIS